MRRYPDRFTALLVLAALVLVGVLLAVPFKRVPNRSSRARPVAEFPDSPPRGWLATYPASPVAGSPFVLRAIEEKYAIQVLNDHEYPVKTYHGLIQATNAAAPVLDHYSSAIAPEFLLYPPALIRQSRLKRIVLCRGLSFAGQARGAIPDFEHDTLYYDVVCGDYSRTYQRHAVHHEFFHIIDYRDDGQVYSDDQWTHLNADTFRYGNGGAKMLGDPSSGLLKAIPGFLTTYATSGVEEDKAELFAYMITDYSLVEKRAVTDPVIRKKMAAMKKLLASFCPAIDHKFWLEVSR